MGLGRLVWGGGDCSLLYTLVILLMCIIIVVVQYSVSSTLYNATGVCALYIWVWIPGSKISVDIDDDLMDSYELSHNHSIICNAVQSIGAPNRPTPVLWHMNIWFKCGEGRVPCTPMKWATVGTSVRRNKHNHWWPDTCHLLGLLVGAVLPPEELQSCDSVTCPQNLGPSQNW